MVRYEITIKPHVYSSIPERFTMNEFQRKAVTTSPPFQ